MRFKYTLYLFAGVLIGAFALGSCSDLDTTPSGVQSSENWYADEFELENSVDFLFKKEYWPLDRGDMWDWASFSDGWDGDFIFRTNQTDFTSGKVNGQTSQVCNRWRCDYQAISIANAIIEHASNAYKSGAREDFVNDIIGEARFVRAQKYSDLVTKWGDVPFVTEVISPNDAFKLGRTDKETIKKWVYDEFDAAADLMYKDYGSRYRRVVKAGAYAFKSRFALYMGDWEIAADAAKKCMDLGTYKLESSYPAIFSDKLSSETIVYWTPKEHAFSAEGLYLYPRNIDGKCGAVPSWDLLAAYTCTDGLPIDESPLFDSHNPFENRDPRCAYTIVPFTRDKGSFYFGIEFHPLKDSVEIESSGKKMLNQDSRINAEYTSFSGLCLKKWDIASGLNFGYHPQNDFVMMRYSEVFLNYAEAKIEMNQIDQSCLDAMNTIRARAYGVDKTQTDKYPAFTAKDQATMRRQVRIERRMEFAVEGILYQDYVRWGWMPKIMTKPCYIMLYPMNPKASEEAAKNYQILKENFFWPYAPDIDEDGIADFSKMEKEGYCQRLYTKAWEDRQVLWPIPTTEIEINPNLTQNPDY